MSPGLPASFSVSALGRRQPPKDERAQREPRAGALRGAARTSNTSSTFILETQRNGGRAPQGARAGAALGRGRPGTGRALGPLALLLPQTTPRELRGGRSRGKQAARGDKPPTQSRRYTQRKRKAGRRAAASRGACHTRGSRACAVRTRGRRAPGAGGARPAAAGGACASPAGLVPTPIMWQTDFKF